jgi:hypothetical protein
MAKQKVKQQQRALQRGAFVDGTWSSYRSGWRSYLKACILLGAEPLPITEETLCDAVTIMFRGFKLKPSTIRRYVSAVRFYAQWHGWDRPPTEHWFRYQLLIKGIVRADTRGPNQKWPIRPKDLIRMKRALIMSNPKHRIFYTAALLCFDTFLRSGQVAPKSATKFAEGYNISRSNLTRTKHGYSLVFTKTKTIQDRSRTLEIEIVDAKSPFSPVPYLDYMLKHLSPKSGSVFAYKTGNRTWTLTYRRFIEMTKMVMGKLGHESASYAGHSYRRGGATWAFKSGVPLPVIKDMGDWRSDAVLLYIVIDSEQRRRVKRLLAKHAVGVFGDGSNV